jgi:hypothetical protein
MRSARTWIVLALTTAALVGIGIDLWGPRRSSLRDFDPNGVAKLETEMWRSYYDRREGRLFQEMAQLLRTQYHLPLLRSYVVAYQAARGAFVFKRGRVRAEYERALPYLERYYGAIRAVSDTPFDSQRAARLELEWWIVHRQREEHPPQDLVDALAALQGEIYAKPVTNFQEHAQLRADAMTIRDTQAAAGNVAVADWQRIETLLQGSWGSLSRAVRP